MAKTRTAKQSKTSKGEPKKVRKNGSFSVQGCPKLTKTEQEILHYTINEYLTPIQIALRRKTSTRVVQKHLSNLKKKGALKIGNNMVRKIQGTSEPWRNYSGFRIHGQEFNIKILWKDDRYVKLYKKGNHVMIDGNRIILYKNSIELYAGEDFYSESVQKAFSKASQYFERIFVKVEHALKIIILKPKSNNISLVNMHISHLENGLAKKCNEESEKIRVHTTDDGKLWFMIDNSLNWNEAETTHPESSKHDMQNTIEPFFNDLRDNPETPLPSQMHDEYMRLKAEYISSFFYCPLNVFDSIF